MRNHLQNGSTFLLRLCAVLVVAGCNPPSQTPDAGDAGPIRPSSPWAVRSSLACGSHEPASPLEFGQTELSQALASLRVVRDARVVLASDPSVQSLLMQQQIGLSVLPESYAIASSGSTTWVIGRDEVGAMYGAFALAENVRREGAFALSLPTPIVSTPAASIRAANLFLTLPTSGETEWWFHDTSFWCEYLELLARARMNVLDLHGMFNMSNTIFPNALLYFASSTTYPSFGVAPQDRTRNVEMLRTIVQMAEARGIHVALMTYRSDTSTSGDPIAPPVPDDAAIQTYTREAVTDLLRHVPKLWRIGFRIGESGHPGDWYLNTFVQGVRDSGASTGLYTRTWGTDKPTILRLSSTIGSQFLIEAKYNAEHLGPPYLVMGGMMGTGWWNYSYEDYLNDPKPYQFIFQIRAGGTHRVFRHASFQRAKRLAETVTIAGSKGLSLEPPHAFTRQRDFLHSVSADRYSPWAFRRDELEYLLYGRLAYDPSTPEIVFRQALADRVGTDALWPAVQAASEIVPWMFTARTCGPDHRQVAPELEYGGPVGFWTQPATAISDETRCGNNGPFDSFAMATVHETVSNFLAGQPTTRFPSTETAAIVLDAAERAHLASSVLIDPNNPEARDVVRECMILGDLGAYWGHKTRAALALGVYNSVGSPALSEWRTVATEELAQAHEGWNALVRDTDVLASFYEPLRMCHFTTYCMVPGFQPNQLFHWRLEAANLSKDTRDLEDAIRVVAMQNRPAPALVSPRTWLQTRRGEGPRMIELLATPVSGVGYTGPWRVRVRFARAVSAQGRVRVLWKRFTNTGDWSSTEAQPVDAARMSYQTEVAGDGAGGLFAVEVETGAGEGWRYPDLTRETPYISVSP